MPKTRSLREISAALRSNEFKWIAGRLNGGGNNRCGMGVIGSISKAGGRYGSAQLDDLPVEGAWYAPATATERGPQTGALDEVTLEEFGLTPDDQTRIITINDKFDSSMTGCSCESCEENRQKFYRDFGVEDVADTLPTGELIFEAIARQVDRWADEREGPLVTMDDLLAQVIPVEQHEEVPA